MTWLSINPKSESYAAVKLAAHIIGTTPEDITPSEMADAYNQVEDSAQPGRIQEDERVNHFVDALSSIFDEEDE